MAGHSCLSFDMMQRRSGYSSRRPNTSGSGRKSLATATPNPMSFMHACGRGTEHEAVREEMLIPGCRSSVGAWGTERIAAPIRMTGRAASQ